MTAFLQLELAGAAVAQAPVPPAFAGHNTAPALGTGRVCPLVLSLASVPGRLDARVAAVEPAAGVEDARAN